IMWHGGYAFVGTDDGAPSIFLHKSVLRRLAWDDLMEGMALKVKVINDPQKPGRRSAVSAWPEHTTDQTVDHSEGALVDGDPLAPLDEPQSEKEEANRDPTASRDYTTSTDSSG